jgi:hypothetical protein
LQINDRWHGKNTLVFIKAVVMMFFTRILDSEKPVTCLIGVKEPRSPELKHHFSKAIPAASSFSSPAHLLTFQQLIPSSQIATLLELYCHTTPWFNKRKSGGERQ